MSDAASSAAVPTATSEAPGYAVGKVLAGETRSLTTLRAEARKRNGHAQDPHADGLVLLEQEHDAIGVAMAQLIAAAERYCASAAGSSDPQIVNEQLQQMVALVSQHASLEERYVYPLFGRYFKGTVEGVSAAMIEERNIADDDINKTIMGLLMKMRIERDGELMIATLKKLQVIEEEHLTQEEHSRVMHPVAGVIDRVADKAMGRDIGLVERDGGAKEIKQYEGERQKI